MVMRTPVLARQPPRSPAAALRLVPPLAASADPVAVAPETTLLTINGQVITLADILDYYEGV